MLPKVSLLYTKFMVLNELNNLKINGKAVSVATKQAICCDLFFSGKKVMQAKLRTYLGPGKEDELTGFDQEMRATLAPWKHYAWLLERPGGFEAAEEIIHHITLFGEDAGPLFEKLSDERTEISAGTSYISTTPNWVNACTAGSLST